MHEPIHNLAFLAAAPGASVTLCNDNDPLLRRIFATHPTGGNDTVRVGLTGALGTSTSALDAIHRRYALLPRAERVRLAVSLNTPDEFRVGLSTYRPGGRLNRGLLSVARLFGPAAFMGRMLTIEGDGLTTAPAEIAARLTSPDVHMAAMFLGSPGDTNTAMLRLTGPNVSAFAKLATGPASDPYVVAEGARLAGFAIRPLRHARTPSVLAQDRSSGMAVLVLAQAGGADTSQIDPDSAGVLELLVELNERDREYAPITESALGRRIDERLGAHPDEALVAAWNRVVERLGENPLPLGLAHGDFVPWNLLRDRNGLIALDWEWSSPRMPPGIDLAHFLFQGSLNLDRPLPRIDDPDGPFARYLQRVGTSPSQANPLFLAYLIDWMLFEITVAGKSVDTLSTHRKAVLETSSRCAS